MANTNKNNDWKTFPSYANKAQKSFTSPCSILNKLQAVLSQIENPDGLERIGEDGRPKRSQWSHKAGRMFSRISTRPCEGCFTEYVSNELVLLGSRTQARDYSTEYR